MIGDKRVPVLEYSENFSGWTDDLTELHEDAVGDTHPIDIASRADAIRQLSLQLRGIESPVIIEIGCSSGFLLRDIQRVLPNAFLLGADVVKAPLYDLALDFPTLPLFRFDLVQCPLPDASIDAVVLLNVLEHIEDDDQAIRQILRLLKPGGIAVIEVPAGPSLYDDYDRALMHYRRYEMCGLVRQCDKVGFSILRKSHLGFFIFPAFAHVKKRNQKEKRVSVQDCVKKQAQNTSSSSILKVMMKVEVALGRYVSYFIGIRCLLTIRKTNVNPY